MQVREFKDDESGKKGETSKTCKSGLWSWSWSGNDGGQQRLPRSTRVRVTAQLLRSASTTVGGTTDGWLDLVSDRFGPLSINNQFNSLSRRYTVNPAISSDTP